jgi:hypothetical protein
MIIEGQGCGTSPWSRRQTFSALAAHVAAGAVQEALVAEVAGQFAGGHPRPSLAEPKRAGQIIVATAALLCVMRQKAGLGCPFNRS